MRKLRFLLLSLLFIPGCGGDAQLRSEIADLRVSMNSMEARQEKLESGQPVPEARVEVGQQGHSAAARIPDRNEELLAEIQRLETTQAELLAKLNNRPPRRPTRNRPDPSSVYAIDISGAPYKGVKDAKVTIVQAFEFA